MGELAASLAHELNQPLPAILSKSQAAQRFPAANPTELEDVREILKISFKTMIVLARSSGGCALW
jgi:two-component system, LuxR family, sensor kinase FixL